jgi:probable rRNA maturation factor
MAKENKRKIGFNYMGQTFYLPERTRLKEFVLALFVEEGTPVREVNYIFCSDEYLHQINLDFLKHDTYTDIITFQYTPLNDPVQSDIYISIDRVRENAQQFDTSFLMELYRVLFHGALHLCGYKDKTEQEKKLMRTKEERYLAGYVSRGTIRK